MTKKVLVIENVPDEVVYFLYDSLMPSYDCPLFLDVQILKKFHDDIKHITTLSVIREFNKFMESIKEADADYVFIESE